MSMKSQQARAVVAVVGVAILMLVLLLRHNNVAAKPQKEFAWYVDPDSHKEALTIQPLTPSDDRTYTLVFSDEFNQPGRTFRDGEDPKWTAEHKNDCKFFYVCKTWVVVLLTPQV
jgi:Beta-glucan synthesis-associated protein SKN1/KRE6/Sbg1